LTPLPEIGLILNVRYALSGLRKPEVPDRTSGKFAEIGDPFLSQARISPAFRVKACTLALMQGEVLIGPVHDVW
jgi:hypothetical protein